MKRHMLLKAALSGFLVALFSVCMVLNTVIAVQSSGATKPVVVPIAADSQWESSNGSEFPGAKVSFDVTHDGPAAGTRALRLSADFTGGGAYCCAGRMLPDLDVADVNAIVMQTCTDNVKTISVRLVDGTGQTHQAKGITVTSDGRWHELRLKPTALAGGEHWGGANDGKWHEPLTGFYLLVGQDSGPTKTPTISFADVQLEATPAPLPTILPADVKPAKCPPGKAFKVTFHWGAVPMNRNYIVFVHFLNQQGESVMGDDHDASVDTTKWTGPVSYTRNVFVPATIPDGKYTIEAGLYVHTKEAPGWKNHPLIAGSGVKSDDGEHFNIGSVTIDHNAPAPPLDSDGPKTLDLKGYKLTFDEEFDKLDVSATGPGTRWIAHTPYFGDFGDARFADPGPNSPFSVKDSVLTIEAKKVGDRWQSGLLSSVDPKGNGFSQKYGYFEMRAKLPKGDGTWPAFWMNDVTMLKDPSHKVDQIEIDVLEQYGLWTEAMHATVHWWRADGTHSAFATTATVHDITDGYHNYGLMWTRENLIWYFDGVEVFRRPTPVELQSHEEYLMINLALGGGWPIDKTPNPSRMLVKYVRAYAKK